MERVALDTSFLIDLQRERRRGDGDAHRFLRNWPNTTLSIAAISVGEYAEGFADPEDHNVGLLINTHDVLPVDAAVARTYAALSRRLRLAGGLIGTNDLWIAATAMRHELALVTANPADFRRVLGLHVLEYRP